VPRHLGELTVVERPLLAQDRVGNGDLADVVQHRGQPEQAQIGLAPPEPLAAE